LIWEPIMAKQCPDCGNSPSYCERSACEGTDVPTDEWEREVIAFKPVPVFDVAQTEGKPLRELNMAAHGDVSALSSALVAVAQERGYDHSLVPEAEWSHGSARGVYAPRSDPPVVEVLERENTADQTRTAIHEFAHAELHAERSGDETSTAEVEAEVVAYVVQHFGLDASTSALYVAALARVSNERVENAYLVLNRELSLPSVPVPPGAYVPGLAPRVGLSRGRGGRRPTSPSEPKDRG